MPLPAWPSRIPANFWLLCQFVSDEFLILKKSLTRYFFTNAALAVFASKLNWRDGLLSTIIMAILSEFIVLAMIITCIDLIRNDDEDKIPESQVGSYCSGHISLRFLKVEDRAK